MSPIPHIEKFRGDLKQSFEEWIRLFEAQCQVLEIAGDLRQQTLLCQCEGKAFNTLSKYLEDRPRAVYNDARNFLRNTFCGDEYKRALESKLRSTKFTSTSEIPNFAPKLRQIIQELYRIDDTDTIELIAVNHVVSDLQPELREHVKILQLTGHARLENVLELIKSKMVCEMSQLSTNAPAFNSSLSRSSTEPDRLTRLENIVEKLSNQVALLTASSKEGKDNSVIVCSHCHKPNQS